MALLHYFCNKMGKTFNFILMADIIDSRKAQQIELMESFKKIISIVNKKARSKIISPLTITLGDEFQGVLTDLRSALEVIIQIEEEIINEKARFKLRYVLLEGQIETEINKKIAHEMLGSGLTEARSLLSQIKNTDDRFYIKINNEEQSAVINHGFIVYQRLIDDWHIDKDYDLVNLFLKYKDYKIVAEKLDKDRSLMWRREKSIRIKEYLSLKEIIYYLSKQ